MVAPIHRYTKKVVLSVCPLIETSQCAEKVSAGLQPIIDVTKQLWVLLPGDVEYRVEGNGAVEAQLREFNRHDIPVDEAPLWDIRPRLFDHLI